MKTLEERYAEICAAVEFTADDIRALMHLVDKATLTFLKRFGVGDAIVGADCKKYVADEVNHHWAMNYEKFNDIIEKMLAHEQFTLFLDLIVDIYIDAAKSK